MSNQNEENSMNEVAGGIWPRVSSTDGSQHPEQQTDELLRWTRPTCTS
jgi:hypothetical protein